MRRKLNALMLLVGVLMATAVNVYADLLPPQGIIGDLLDDQPWLRYLIFPLGAAILTGLLLALWPKKKK